MRGVSFLFCIAGCVQSDAVACSNGHVCPADTTCDPDHGICVTGPQRDACAGKQDRETCTYQDLLGMCDRGVCLLGDPDGDGRVDNQDNCPEVANPEQEDRDGDQFGDACDHCPDKPTARNHDEDSDSYGDDCDLCPGIADWQIDSDHDTVADVCESFVGTWKQELFEPFVDLAGWRNSGATWNAHDDSVAPDTPLDITDVGLVNESHPIDATQFALEIGYTSDRPLADRRSVRCCALRRVRRADRGLQDLLQPRQRLRLRDSIRQRHAADRSGLAPAIRTADGGTEGVEHTRSRDLLSHRP